MIRNLISTNPNWGICIVRVGLGLVMLPHGAQKLLGWFGGAGVTETLDFFASLGIPVFLGVLVILIETLGAAALVAGFVGRLAAVGVACVMLGALFTVPPSGFFMNWSGSLSGEGYEFHLLAIAMCAAVASHGSGSFSVDRLLMKRRRRH